MRGEREEVRTVPLSYRDAIAEARRESGAWRQPSGNGSVRGSRELRVVVGGVPGTPLSVNRQKADTTRVPYSYAIADWIRCNRITSRLPLSVMSDDSLHGEEPPCTNDHPTGTKPVIMLEVASTILRHRVVRLLRN